MQKRIAAIIGEGVHTSLRKFCDSVDAADAWRAIQNMDKKEWQTVCETVANEIVKEIEKDE